MRCEVDLNSVVGKGLLSSLPVGPQPLASSVTTAFVRSGDLMPEVVVTSGATEVTMLRSNADAVLVGEAIARASQLQVCRGELPDAAHQVTTPAFDDMGNASAHSMPANITGDRAPPFAPTDVMAAPQYDRIEIAGTASTSPDAGGYIVWRKEDAQPDMPHINLFDEQIVTDTQCCQDQCVDGVISYYGVTAVDDARPSDFVSLQADRTQTTADHRMVIDDLTADSGFFEHMVQVDFREDTRARDLRMELE